MTDTKDKDLEEAKRTMAALVRQPPKTHDEMKGGKAKPKPKAGKSPARRGRPRKQDK